MKTLNLAFSQTGLAYFPDFAVYGTYYIKDHTKKSHALWQTLVRDVDRHCKATDYHTVVLAGVGFELWEAWSRELGYPKATGMGSKRKLDELSQAFGNTGGDLWFHVKSDNAADVQKLQKVIFSRLKDLFSQEPLIVPAEKRHKGKVLGGRFIDGLENPADAEDLSDRVVVGEEDAPYRGAAFLLTQKFVHDWTKLNAMSELQKENMIGRDHKDRLVPMEDESSHIKRVRQLDGQRINFRLVRQALPYGHKADNKANEEGVFFAGYVKATHVIDRTLDGIAGSQKGNIQDSLFSAPAATMAPTGWCRRGSSAASI